MCAFGETLAARRLASDQASDLAVFLARVAERRSTRAFGESAREGQLSLMTNVSGTVADNAAGLRFRRIADLMKIRPLSFNYSHLAHLTAIRLNVETIGSRMANKSWRNKLHDQLKFGQPLWLSRISTIFAGHLIA